MSNTNLTAAESQLHALMFKVSRLEKQRGICEWAQISGRRVMCSPIFHADGRFKTWKFVVDGKRTTFDDISEMCRAAD